MEAKGWVYCLRQQRSIAFAGHGTAPRLLVDHSAHPSGRSGFESRSPFLTSPYGLALDKALGQVWISDKHTDSLWCLDLENLMAPGDPKLPLNLPQAIRTKGGHCPCMLDWHPESGLLVACFGLTGGDGNILQYKRGQWVDWTGPEFSDSVTHCCWSIYQSGIYYVTRSNSVLWHMEYPRSPPRMLSSAMVRAPLPNVAGECRELRLRYVQGMVRGPAPHILFLADASLGAIFEIDLKTRHYRVACGKPTLSDSLSKFRTDENRSDIWLGAARALAVEQPGVITWLSGDTGRLFHAVGTELLDGGPATCSSIRTLAGCGMIAIR